MSRPETPRLEELQAALDRADLDTVRRTLLELDPDEQRLLEQEMGREAFARARSAAARGRRRGKLGRVLVLPGIMGTELDSVNRKGDADRIWINFVRLISGRLRDLRLDPQGEPDKDGIHVRTAGVHRKTYVPLLMELDTRWHVRPFPFDWREDIDRSAARLDGEVKAFGAGDPVHLVAHSMGGLVSRRFIQLFPDTWKAMNDPSGNGRGGRLVMLGTPNRGSFAIPLTLTGAEKVFKLLATADVPNSPRDLLEIIGTFPGLYQMLPSPTVDLGDDHEDLFDSARWGKPHVSSDLLARADGFLRALNRVIDAERLLYIAGANLETPSRIHIGPGGQFTYEATLDGDGRVSHELGLLEGVTTYWVDKGVHGDLVKHSKVLDAITELLATGKTAVLPTTKPPTPLDRRSRGGRIRAARFDDLPSEVDAILARPRLERSAGAEPELTPEEQIQLENLGLAEYLGTGEDTPPEVRGEPAERERAAREALSAGKPARATRPPKIAVEVVWGNIIEVDADVHAVGHYQGVLPQNAERALDCAVSGLTWDEAELPENQSRLVISEHTRRGQLRGALGDVSFFPLPRVARKGGLVAVAGMGHPGTFDMTALRLLIRELTLAVMALPKVTEICTVLIGSGEGTLSVERAVRGLLEGIEEALEGRDRPGGRSRHPKFIVVELYRDRAEEIRRYIESRAAKIAGVSIAVEPQVTAGSNGEVSVEGCFELVIDSTLRAARAREGSLRRKLFDDLMREIPPTEGLRGTALAEMTKLAASGREAGKEWQRRYRIGPRPREDGNGSDVPTRISFTWDDGVVRIAAITGATTVSERLVRIDSTLIDELVARMTDPRAEDLAAEPADAGPTGEGLSRDLARLLIPREFREVLRNGPYIVEVDRTMARVHWEACSQFSGGAPVSDPMGLDQLARQLRTTYSPAPAPPPYRSGPVRALVVGDPGDPENGESLPGAREEALAVHELLTSNGVTSDLLIGAPDGQGRGPIPGIAPASRFEVLRRLVRGGLDLVHYAGHGDFDEERPDRAGWLFKGGLLTSAELERIDEVPSLVVANACLSARTAQELAEKSSDTDPRTEAGLLPGLADEFFHLGVRNYIGTAWEVNDIGATLFATTFYETLFQEKSYGEAVSAARRTLHDRSGMYGPLWAAYQHYGDPTSRLRAVSPQRQDESPTS